MARTKDTTKYTFVNGKYRSTGTLLQITGDQIQRKYAAQLHDIMRNNPYTNPDLAWTYDTWYAHTELVEGRDPFAARPNNVESKQTKQKSTFGSMIETSTRPHPEEDVRPNKVRITNSGQVIQSPTHDNPSSTARTTNSAPDSASVNDIQPSAARLKYCRSQRYNYNFIGRILPEAIYQDIKTAIRQGRWLTCTSEDIDKNRPLSYIPPVEGEVGWEEPELKWSDWLNAPEAKKPKNTRTSRPGQARTRKKAVAKPQPVESVADAPAVEPKGRKRKRGVPAEGGYSGVALNAMQNAGQQAAETVPEPSRRPGLRPRKQKDEDSTPAQDDATNVPQAIFVPVGEANRPELANTATHNAPQPVSATATETIESDLANQASAEPPKIGGRALRLRKQKSGKSVDSASVHPAINQPSIVAEAPPRAPKPNIVAPQVHTNEVELDQPASDTIQPTKPSLIVKLRISRLNAPRLQQPQQTQQPQQNQNNSGGKRKRRVPVGFASQSVVEEAPVEEEQEQVSTVDVPESSAADGQSEHEVHQHSNTTGVGKRKRNNKRRKVNRSPTEEEDAYFEELPVDRAQQRAPVVQAKRPQRSITKGKGRQKARTLVLEDIEEEPTGQQDDHPKDVDGEAKEADEEVAPANNLPNTYKVGDIDTDPEPGWPGTGKAAHLVLKPGFPEANHFKVGMKPWDMVMRFIDTNTGKITKVISRLPKHRDAMDWNDPDKVKSQASWYHQNRRRNLALRMPGYEDRKHWEDDREIWLEGWRENNPTADWSEAAKAYGEAFPDDPKRTANAMQSKYDHLQAKNTVPRTLLAAAAEMQDVEMSDADNESNTDADGDTAMSDAKPEPPKKALKKKAAKKGKGVSRDVVNKDREGRKEKRQKTRLRGAAKK